MKKKVLSKNLCQNFVHIARQYGLELALGPVIHAIPENFLDATQLTWRARIPRTADNDAIVGALNQLATSPHGHLLYLVDILTFGNVRKHVAALVSAQKLEEAAAIMKGLTIPYGAPQDVLGLIKLLSFLGRDDAQLILAESLAKEIVYVASNTSPETLPGLIFLDAKPEVKDDLYVRVFDENSVETLHRPIDKAPQRLFCAALKNASMSNLDFVQLQDGSCLFDGMTYKKNHEWQRPYIYGKDKSVLLSNKNVFRTEKSPILYLGRTAEHGHFIIDAIDRLYSYAEAGAPTVQKVLVQQRPRPEYLEFLSSMGLPSAPDAYVSLRQATKFHQLIVPSLGTNLPAVNPKSIRFLQMHAARLVNRLVPTRSPRIYLARKPGQRRNLRNLNLIETTLNKAGFTKIYPEDMTFLEQIAVMQQSKIVAGIHGSALFNLIWAPPGTQIGVFVPYSWQTWQPAQLEMLFDILRCADHQAAAILGCPEPINHSQNRAFNADFELSYTALKRWIDAIDMTTCR